VKLTRDDLVESVSRLQPSQPVTADDVATDLGTPDHVMAIATALEKLVDEGRLRSTVMYVRQSPRDEFAVHRVSYHVPTARWTCSEVREHGNHTNGKYTNGSVATSTS
jgi:hypothetical protein